MTMVSFWPVFFTLMSAEPGNLCGLSSFKFSGIASKKVLDISVKKTGQKETIVMTTSNKKGSKAQRPGLMLCESGVKKSSKKGLAKVAKATGGSFYRRDLQELAEKKYARVKTSLKKKKVVVKSRRAGK